MRTAIVAHDPPLLFRPADPPWALSIPPELVPFRPQPGEYQWRKIPIPGKRASFIVLAAELVHGELLLAGYKGCPCTKRVRRGPQPHLIVKIRGGLAREFAVLNARQRQAEAARRRILRTVAKEAPWVRADFRALMVESLFFGPQDEDSLAIDAVRGRGRDDEAVWLRRQLEGLRNGGA